MARSHSPDLEQALRDTLGADAIQKGAAVDGIGKEFIWAVAAASKPKLKIDCDPEITAVTMVGSLWMYQGPVATGTAHTFAPKATRNQALAKAG